MNDSQFHSLAEDVFQRIEDGLESLETEVDYEQAGSVFYIYLPNDVKLVLNKQEPLHELWLATPENGFHFCYNDGKWLNKRGSDELFTLLTTCCQKHLGHCAFDLSF